MEFENIKNIYHIKIDKKEDRIIILVEDNNSKNLFELIIDLNDLDNKKIQSIEKYYLFIQNCFMNNSNYDYKIFQVNIVNHIKNIPTIKLILSYNSEILDFSDTWDIDLKIMSDEEKEEHELKKKIKELEKELNEKNEKIFELENILGENKKIIKNYEKELFLPEVMTKSKFSELIKQYENNYFKNIENKYNEFMNDNEDRIVLELQKNNRGNYECRSYFHIFFSSKGKIFIFGYSFGFYQIKKINNIMSIKLLFDNYFSGEINNYICTAYSGVLSNMKSGQLDGHVQNFLKIVIDLCNRNDKSDIRYNVSGI